MVTIGVHPQPLCSSSQHFSTELLCISTYWFANNGIFRWIEIGLKSNASVCNYWNVIGERGIYKFTLKHHNKAKDIACLFYTFWFIVLSHYLHFSYLRQTWPMSLIMSGMKCDKSVLIRHSVRNSLVMTSHFTDTGRQHCQCNILIVFSSPNPKITEAIGKKKVHLLYIREPLISILMWNVSSSYTV